MHYFKSLSRVKSTQDVKMSFNQGNELKLTQVELLSFFYFKNTLSESTQLFLNHIDKLNIKLFRHSYKFVRNVQHLSK